jgi:hypothetical protein
MRCNNFNNFFYLIILFIFKKLQSFHYFKKSFKHFILVGTVDDNSAD